MDTNTEDGGSTFLQNIGIQPPHYMVQQLRKPQIQIISRRMFEKQGVRMCTGFSWLRIGLL
jgi:hypothetical protein